MERPETAVHHTLPCSTGRAMTLSPWAPWLVRVCWLGMANLSTRFRGRWLGMANLNPRLDDWPGYQPSLRLLGHTWNGSGWLFIPREISWSGHHLGFHGGCMLGLPLAYTRYMHGGLGAGMHVIFGP